MPTYSEPSDRLALSRFDYQILLALLARPLNGYSIARQCEMDSRRTPGSISNGALYRTLKRLASFSFIEIASESPKTYQITGIGRDYLKEEIVNCQRFIELAEERKIRARVANNNQQATTDAIMQLYD